MAVIGISHTTDPLNWLVNYAFPGAHAAQATARAPRRDTTFRYLVLGPALPPGQGGPPIVDGDRYAALLGEYPAAPTDGARDYAVLVSCGPFRALGPGQSVELRWRSSPAKTPTACWPHTSGAAAYRGTALNLQPDQKHQPFSSENGNTGINGHEICYTPPEGVTFNYDVHCTSKYYLDPAYTRPLATVPARLHPARRHRRASPIVTALRACGRTWIATRCTGLDGKETVIQLVRADTGTASAAFRRRHAG